MGDGIGQGDAFRRVTRGDKLKIPARAWNALLEMGARWGSRGVGGGGAGEVSPIRRSNIVTIRNDSGGNLVAGNILGITGVCFDHADNAEEFIAETQFTGDTPALADHKGMFAVLLEPILDGESGEAVVYGIAPAQVNIVTAGDKFCDVTDADATKLTSGSSGGAEILFAPSGTGTKWCVIRIGGGASQAGLIPVSLTSDAGSDGTSSTTPSYTYKWPVNMITGEEIKLFNGTRATALAPSVGRNKGSFVQASYGEVYMDSTNNPVLWRAYETENVCVDGT